MGVAKGGHFQRRRGAAPSANIPAEAGGRTFVRHQQLTWWLPTAHSIKDSDWTKLGENVRIGSYTGIEHDPVYFVIFTCFIIFLLLFL
jgi:hypothetical protein